MDESEIAKRKASKASNLSVIIACIEMINEASREAKNDSVAIMINERSNSNNILVMNDMSMETMYYEYLEEWSKNAIIEAGSWE
jgi:hypothetical protein